MGDLVQHRAYQLGDDMTKLEFITQHLRHIARHPNADEMHIVSLAQDILALCTPTEYLTIGQFGARIGRNPTTVKSWITRGQHDIPAALAGTGLGDIWDGADIDAWAEAHTNLLGLQHGKWEVG